MNVQSKPLSQINQEAVALLAEGTAILLKELGVANTLRFLNQFSMGYGNYTEEREGLFKDLTLDEILGQMRDD